MVPMHTETTTDIHSVQRWEAIGRFSVLTMCPQTDIQIAHPDVVFYDFYGAWGKLTKGDKEAYLCIANFESR
jgi:hypothetical protein